MTAKLTFHTLDYADMRNDSDSYDKRIDLPVELEADLRSTGLENDDIVCFS